MMNDETKVSHKQEQQQVENEHARELTESELAKVSGGLKPAARGKLKVRGGDDDLDDLEVERKLPSVSLLPITWVSGCESTTLHEKGSLTFSLP